MIVGNEALIVVVMIVVEEVLTEEAQIEGAEAQTGGQVMIEEVQTEEGAQTEGRGMIEEAQIGGRVTIEEEVQTEEIGEAQKEGPHNLVREEDSKKSECLIQRKELIKICPSRSLHSISSKIF